MQSLSNFHSQNMEVKFYWLNILIKSFSHEAIIRISLSFDLLNVFFIKLGGFPHGVEH